MAEGPDKPFGDVDWTGGRRPNFSYTCGYCGSLVRKDIPQPLPDQVDARCDACGRNPPGDPQILWLRIKLGLVEHAHQDLLLFVCGFVPALLAALRKVDAFDDDQLKQLLDALEKAADGDSDDHPGSVQITQAITFALRHTLRSTPGG